MKLLMTASTRPEVIKMISVFDALKKKAIDPVYVTTGQHYDREMFSQFLEEIHLPQPDYNLTIGSGSHAYQTGQGMIELERVLMKENPDLVTANGDTNSLLATALTSVKSKIPFAHIEAGLRSFDRTMPEETNRIVADHCSELLFAPSPLAVKHLKEEGIQEGVFMTGNTVVDAVKQLEPKLGTKVLDNMSLDKQRYILVTAHRSENVDVEEKCRDIVTALTRIQFPTVYPLHPRTLSFLKGLGY